MGEGQFYSYNGKASKNPLPIVGDYIVKGNHDCENETGNFLLAKMQLVRK
jgi:hypothetical protein